MPFPLTRRGTYKSAVDIDPAHAAAALATGLERVHASSIRQHDGEVEFEVRFFRHVMKTNLLVAIDRGTFRVHREGQGVAVDYELSFRRALLIISVSVAVVFGVLADSPSSFQRLETVLLGWLWLFGMNYLIACARIPSFIRNALTRAAHHVG